MRGSLLTIVIACVISCLPAFGAPVYSGEPLQYDLKIDSQPLGKALQEFAKQSGVQVIFFSRVTEGHEAPSLKGKFTAAAALEHLLNDSRLTFRELNPRTIEVHPKAAVNLLETSRAHAPELSALEALGVPASALSADSARVRLAQADSEAQSRAANSEDTKPSPRAEREPILTDLGEVVVTGTNIRGVYPSSSPVQTYTAEDIARTGATTTEQFIQKLPQNMGTRTQYSSAAIGFGNQQNTASVAAVDLRGLGVGTSLVLVNGRRLGLADMGRTADVSMIPASAIERVEVLTDGASAIYGSDAIGGVVNFVLRDDFDGAETRLSFGGVTDGGMRQGELSQTIGRSWGSGHALVAYTAFSASELDLADRDYARDAVLGNLTPDDRRQNLLGSFSQNITDRFSVNGDVSFSRRKVQNRSTDVVFTSFLNRVDTNSHSETDSAFLNLALDYDISSKLRGRFTATYAESELERRTFGVFYNRTPPTPAVTPGLGDRGETDYSALDLTAVLDGTLLEFPAGSVRFSLGGGAFDEDYAGHTTNNATNVNGMLGRMTSYAFGELFVPLVDASQGVPLVHRLELNVAARYTRYDDRSTPARHQEFGDGTDPKIGLLWAPFEAISFRGTYGTSFRAPSMIEVDETFARIQLNTVQRIPRVTGPVANTVQVGTRPLPGLQPETATSYTLGFDIAPPRHSELRIRGTYYNISYDDRIGAPFFAPTLFITPELFPTIVYRPPSAAFIEDLLRTSTSFTGFPGNVAPADPAATAQSLFNSYTWIWDNRTRNLSVSEQDGFDISLTNSFDTDWGEVRYGANLTRILSYRQQVSSDAPVLSGVDRVGLPVDFRGRLYVGATYGRFDGTLSVNYADDYLNDIASSQGAAVIDSWTTADLSLSYDLARGVTGAFQGVRLSLSVQNLFDKDPPYVAGGSFTTGALVYPVGYDPANANPLGRVIVVGASKKW